MSTNYDNPTKREKLRQDFDYFDMLAQMTTAILVFTTSRIMSFVVNFASSGTFIRAFPFSAHPRCRTRSTPWKGGPPHA
jgi:hypothetical protein